MQPVRQAAHGGTGPRRAGPARRLPLSLPGSAGLLLLVVTLLAGGCAITATPDPKALERSGSAAYRNGDYRAARTLWLQGLDQASTQQDTRASAELLIRLARLDEAVGRYPRALARAFETLRLARARQDARQEAEAEAVIALVWRRSGAYASASDHAQTALALARRIGDRELASESLRHLGAVHQARGDYDGALERYLEALELSRSSGDPNREAEALNNIGGIHRLKGAYQKAQQHYDQALALSREQHNRPIEARVLGNRCVLRQNLNVLVPALDDCRHALRLALSMGDPVREANNRNNIGAIHRARGEYGSALRQYRRALALKRGLPDRAGEARALNNIGELELARGHFDRARARFDEALQIQREIGDRAGESAVRYNLGLNLLRRGDRPRALVQFRLALVMQLAVGERDLLWRLYDDLSRLYAETGSPRTAVFFGKQAVNTLQAIRADIRQLDPRLQRSYLDARLRAYKQLAGLLIDQGRLPEAQQILDMLKQREYADFIVRAGPDGRGDTGFTTSEGPLDARLQAFRSDLLTLADELDRLQAKKRQRFLLGQSLGRDEQQRLDSLKEAFDRAGQALDALIEQVAQALPESPQISEIDEATLEALFNLQGTVADVGERTGTRAVMLHYLVTRNRLYILVTTPTAQLARQIEVTATELHRRIQTLRSALLTPSSEAREAAAALHELLIAPVADDLEQVGTELIWVSMDGALRYIPLAALYDRRRERWLIQDYAVAMLTRATQASWKDSPAEGWTVAGLGLSRKIEGYSRLKAVAEELDGIVREQNRDDPDGVLPGIIGLDEAFTAASLEELLDLQLFSVIHIASHFVLPEAGDYRDAFLLTGDGEELALERFQRYRFDSVELLTLSACNTAMGETAATGDFDALSGREVEGLGALVQGRGAASVLATLWEVADAATATLMQHFYRLRSEGHTKAEALRLAQLAFIEDGAGASGDSSDGRGVGIAGGEARSLSHPYFWAPFVLMGNWQ